MSNRPLLCSRGNINTTELSLVYLDFNYFEISDDIAIATYPYTGDQNTLLLKPPESNAYCDSLIIQVLKTSNPFAANQEVKSCVNIVFILKDINSLFDDSQSINHETLDIIFNSESITQTSLPDLVASHLALLEMKTTSEKLKLVYLKGWAYNLARAITDMISYYLIPQALQKFKNIDVERIKDLGFSLKSNLHKSSPTLDEMAKAVNMSPTKFKTIFKEIWGLSPHQYILGIKLDYAMHLLKQQSLSISEISYKVGFNHPSALTRLFQSKLGLSPHLAVAKASFILLYNILFYT